MRDGVQIVKLRDVVLGHGRPKTIVPFMARDIEQIHAQASDYQRADFDVLEFRADFLAGVKDFDLVGAALKTLKTLLPNKPILFTFRTTKEGGQQEISEVDYTALNQMAASSGDIDMIDVELFTGNAWVSEMLKAAHECGVKVLMSNHDFDQTPAQEEIVVRLCQMQAFRADILKIAVMPQSKQDVLTLLAASAQMEEQFAQQPFIALSMGELGVVSRIAAGVFGSAATFGALKEASAPGQIEIEQLKAGLKLLS